MYYEAAEKTVASVHCICHMQYITCDIEVLRNLQWLSETC